MKIGERVGLGVSRDKALGVMLGSDEGDCVTDGALVGMADGSADGMAVGTAEGDMDGVSDGIIVGVMVGLIDGSEVGVKDAELTVPRASKVVWKAA